MNRFDDDIRKAALRDAPTVPERVHRRTIETLEALPDRVTFRKGRPMLRTWISAAACAAVMLLAVMPNVSTAYAAAASELPVIGRLVEVLNVRRYFYGDGNHELEAEVPGVSDSRNQEAAELINSSVDQLVETVVDRFFADLEISAGNGYGSVKIDYDTVVNNDSWFTLRIRVSETAASGSTYDKYYHIDRVNGRYITLGDVFDEEGLIGIEKLIIDSMEKQMLEDESKAYWPEYVCLTGDENFYPSDGAIVICFDEYIVSPGYMGMPTFAVPQEMCIELANEGFEMLFEETGE